MGIFTLNKKTDEQQLVLRLQKYEPAAQKKLYDQLAKKMLSVCRSYISDTHYAEDCMINGFCKVYAHVQKFKSEGSFEGWVRRIMVNECLTFLRSNKTLIYIDDSRYADYDTLDDELEELAFDFNVHDVLGKLPEAYRLVFNLHVLEDYSHQEIAEMLSISVSSSKTQLFRAKAKLREIVSQQKNKGDEVESV